MVRKIRMLLHKLAEAKQNLTIDDPRISDLLQRIRKIVLPSGESGETLISTILGLVETHQTLSKSCSFIQRYEQDLASILEKERDMAESSIHVGELHKRSLMTLMEADRQCRSQIARIEELESVSQKKSAECKELRARLEEVEAESMNRNICILQERSMDEIGSDGTKRSALNTLIDGYRKSEARRRALEIEVVRQRALLATEGSGRKPQEFSGNVFIELQELKEIVKELVSKRMLEGSEIITESLPRFPPPAKSLDKTEQHNQWTKVSGRLSNSSKSSMERLTDNLFSDLGTSRCV
jgi:hypothetical protein